MNASSSDVTSPVGNIYTTSGNIIYGDSTNKNFYYSASDEESGIAYLQYKGPNDTSWKSYTDSLVISRTAENGKYTFRAVDNFGNISLESFIYLDIISPVGKIYSYNQEHSSGAVINSEYIYFEATDEMSGLDMVYVRAPGASSYTSYTNNTFLSTQGTYYFYATDYAGNISDTYSITISRTPKVNIIRDYDFNTVYLTWSDNSYKVYINDDIYEKNTIISEEGNYSVEIIDSYGNVGYDEFSIIHSYRIVGSFDPTCYSQGYTIYECITCREQQYDNILEMIDHNYMETIINPTCINEGYTLLHCTECLMETETNYTAPLGHKMEEFTKDVSCTEDGGLFKICSNCGIEEGIEVIEALGHIFESEVSLKATCEKEGIREFYCKRCDYFYESNISASNHHYILKEEVINNNQVKQIYECVNCGLTETKVIDRNSEEVVGEFKEIIKNQHTYLIVILIITSGLWSVYMGIKLILAVKSEEKQLAKKRIFNYVIGLIIIFIIIMICPFIIKGIGDLK